MENEIPNGLYLLFMDSKYDYYDFFRIDGCISLQAILLLLNIVRYSELCCVVYLELKVCLTLSADILER